MSRAFVWTLAVCLIAFVAAGVTHAYPEWLADSGLDVWNAPLYQAELDAYQRMSDDLDRRCVAVRRRNEMKRSLAVAVANDQLSLDQAAAEFRALSATNPIFLALLRGVHPGCSDDELYCRNVMETVRNLAIPAAQRDLAVARLDARLKSLKSLGCGVVYLAQ